VAFLRPGPGPLPVVYFLALATAYFAVLANAPGASRSYLLAVVLGGGFVGAAAVLIFGAGPRQLLERVTRRIPRLAIALLVVFPWLALFAVAARGGLWWTQRPSALRFLAAWALVGWTMAICSGTIRARLPIDPARRAACFVALLIAVPGIQGLAFGTTPFGSRVSILLAAVAAMAFLAPVLGNTRSSLKLFVAFAGTLAALASAELAVRLLDIGRNVQEVDRKDLAREFYSLTPPRSAFVNQPKALDEFGPAFIEINSLGIRGPEIPEGRTDWLLIGDSMIEARQLPWEQTIGAKLQDALRSRSLPLRVVSHGMRGWSPLLEWNWYLKVGRRLQPRVVLLFFFWNDLWTAGDEATTFRAVLRPDGRPDHFDVVVEPGWIWYTHVRLMRIAEDVWHRASLTQVRRAFSTMASGTLSATSLDSGSADRLARSLADPPLSASAREALLTRREDELDPELQGLARGSLWPRVRPFHLWTEGQLEAARRTELELQRFAEDVAADGARFVLVFVPNPMQIGPEECSVGRLFDRIDTGVTLPPDSGIQTFLRMVADRHGFEFLDPSDAMRARVQAEHGRGAPPLYLRADCHWSARGHQFMADYLVDWHSRGKRGSITP
jgi:hypothetical protein